MVELTIADIAMLAGYGLIVMSTVPQTVRLLLSRQTAGLSLVYMLALWTGLGLIQLAATAAGQSGMMLGNGLALANTTAMVAAYCWVRHREVRRG